jgi:hypothetical protein
VCRLFGRCARGITMLAIVLTRVATKILLHTDCTCCDVCTHCRRRHNRGPRRRCTECRCCCWLLRVCASTPVCLGGACRALSASTIIRSPVATIPVATIPVATSAIVTTGSLDPRMVWSCAFNFKPYRKGQILAKCVQ